MIIELTLTSGLKMKIETKEENLTEWLKNHIIRTEWYMTTIDNNQLLINTKNIETVKEATIEEKVKQ